MNDEKGGGGGINAASNISYSFLTLWLAKMRESKLKDALCAEQFR